MKKQLLTLALLLLVCSLSQARGVRSIMNEFKDEAHAEYVHVSPLLMRLAEMVCDDDDVKAMNSSIKSVRVLDLEECGICVKERFNKRIGTLSTEGYETLIRVNDSDSKVRVLIKQEGDYIRELLVVCASTEDCALVQIKGKISKQDVDDLVDEQTKKKDGCH